MGLFNKFMDKGRGPRLKRDYKKLEPTLIDLMCGDRAGEFLQAIYKRKTEAETEADQIHPGTPRMQLGMKIQENGKQRLNFDPVQGGAEWIIGALLESKNVGTPECQEIAEFLNQRFIIPAISSPVNH